jgi:2-methylcitrate dehydratase PrpD
MQFQTFLHQTSANYMPDEVIEFAKRCLLDLVGVMIAGSQTHLTRIIKDHAAEQFGAGSLSASLLLDGRMVSPAGAALSNGMMIDSIDAHDGFKPAKGHVGCHVLPALIAFLESLNIPRSGKAFLSDLIIGYEIGGRAGVALHASAPDYHTSGAWGAVTAASLGARLMQFDLVQTRHAMGIGEYHGPRSQMMRCIDHPTMLKDGSGWGAMAGVSAAFLARSGFTGAPAISVEDDDVAEFWNDLGTRWTILEQYFKPYPVCRWAQPATAAALSIMKDHQISHEAISTIEVFSFHEACRLAKRSPLDTEQAQYSLPFPVAAALVFGKIGPKEIDGECLCDPRVLRLSENMVLSEHNDYNAAFPKDRYAHVHVTMRDGTVFKSERHQANGDPETPLSDTEISEKYFGLAEPVIGAERAGQIHQMITRLEKQPNVSELFSLLRQPV